MPTNEEMYDEADKLKDAGKLDEAVAKLNEIVGQDPTTRWRIRRWPCCTGGPKHDEAVTHALKRANLNRTTRSASRR